MELLSNIYHLTSNDIPTIFIKVEYCNFMMSSDIKYTRINVLIKKGDLIWITRDQ